VGRAGFSNGPRKLKIVLWPRAAQSLRAGMMCRNAGWYLGAKKKREAMLAQRTRSFLRPQVKSESQRLHHIRAADQRGAGAVAVFGHPHARRRAQNRRCGGDVERAQAVAAGANDIEDFAGADGGVERRLDGFGAQGAGERGDFRDRFSFARKLAQKIGLGGGSHRFVHEQLDGFKHLLVRERLRGGQLADEFVQHRAILGFRARSKSRK